VCPAACPARRTTAKTTGRRPDETPDKAEAGAGAEPSPLAGHLGVSNNGVPQKGTHGRQLRRSRHTEVRRPEQPVEEGQEEPPELLCRRGKKELHAIYGPRFTAYFIRQCCPSGGRSALAGSGSVGDTRARVEPPSRPRSFSCPTPAASLSRSAQAATT